MSVSKGAKLKEVLRRLEREYKRPVWKCWGKPVSVLVETILSQNTSNANSSAGYRQLRRRFRSWEAVAAAKVDEVERCIRVSGLSRIKAPRIGAILRRIRAEHGRISLDHLAAMAPAVARDYLLSFDGVGPKTACCVLLFSLNMPLFPVDTHIVRIARRLGIVPDDTTAERCEDLLTPLIARDDRYAIHILLIQHGRRICTARSPHCDWCCLSDICPTGKGIVD